MSPSPVPAHPILYLSSPETLLVAQYTSSQLIGVTGYDWNKILKRWSQVSLQIGDLYNYKVELYLAHDKLVESDGVNIPYRP